MHTTVAHFKVQFLWHGWGGYLFSMHLEYNVVRLFCIGTFCKLFCKCSDRKLFCSLWDVELWL